MKRVTEEFKVEVARYYLNHLNLTQEKVAANFGLSPGFVAQCLKFYIELVKFERSTTQIEVGVRWDPDELKGVYNDAHRFERLIKTI